MASPVTLNGLSGGGYASGYSTTYATARDTAGGGHAHTKLMFGQSYTDPNFSCTESFIHFDTGAELPDDATVTVATLKIYGTSSSHATHFVINVAAYDWGGTLENGDFRTAAQLAALTPLATFDIASTAWSTSGYNTFTNTGDGSNMLAAINKTGYTYFILYSDRHAAGTQPANDENQDGKAVDDATYPAQLYLEYTVPASFTPKVILL